MYLKSLSGLILVQIILATNQGSVRRGAASVNLSINHPDIEEFLGIRRPKGDVNRQCLNLHQCVVIDDKFMNRVENRDPKALRLWGEILKSRLETGEPYIMFDDNINNANPEAYKKNNLNVSMTNICSEIALYTDPLHSFICCLSSLTGCTLFLMVWSPNTPHTLSFSWVTCSTVLKSCLK